MLKPYEVKSVKVRVPEEDKPLQGYKREALWDAWNRYLPPLPSPIPESGEHLEQPEPERETDPRQGFVPERFRNRPRSTTDSEREVPHVPDVPLLRGTEAAPAGTARGAAMTCSTRFSRPAASAARAS